MNKAQEYLMSIPISHETTPDGFREAKKSRCELHPKLREGYNYQWDSFFCRECRVWLEPECGCPAEDCEFVGRPATAEGLRDDL